MSDESDVDRHYTGTSPWPILVALSLAMSEAGVFLGVRPISVTGLLLFVGAVSGILRESGYITHLERGIGVLGGALIAIGISLILLDQTGTTVRGQSIVIAGIISLIGAALWVVYIRIQLQTMDSSDAETLSD